MKSAKRATVLHISATADWSETMTVKEWLSRARTLDMEILALESARADAMARCLSVTSRPHEIVVNGGGSDWDSKLAAFADLSGEIDELIFKLCEIKTEILRAINQVEDGVSRTVLIERYISGKTWEQIAEDMNYSYSQVVKYLYPKAVAQIKMP